LRRDQRRTETRRPRCPLLARCQTSVTAVKPRCPSVHAAPCPLPVHGAPPWPSCRRFGTADAMSIAVVVHKSVYASRLRTQPPHQRAQDASAIHKPSSAPAAPGSPPARRKQLRGKVADCISQHLLGGPVGFPFVVSHEPRFAERVPICIKVANPNFSVCRRRFARARRVQLVEERSTVARLISKSRWLSL